MKKILVASSLVLLVVAMTGCKKEFFDINDNPNTATPSSITADLILPRAQHAIGARMATSYRVSGSWLGYWARSGTYGPNVEEESYGITTTFEADEWSGWYDILTDLDVMEKKAKASGQTFYEGIAKTLKTIGFMYLVDQYNNVPYSKAFDLSGNILPAYDNGPDIYADLLNQLDLALDLIKNATPANNTRLTDADIMFKGNATQWRRFINTQRLKLLIRQSQIPGFSPTAQIAKITADGSGFIGAGQTAYVQPVYVQDNGKQNPFWNSYERLFNGDLADQFNRANNFLLNLYRNNSDIRYQYVYDPAQAPLNSNTYYGYNYGESLPNSDPYKAANSSGVGGPGLAKSPGQAQWVFTSVESMFLQAEAIQRGWLAGDAQAAYTSAVRESFVWLGVPAAVLTADAYLAQAGTVMSWAAAATSAAKINLIVLQKYIALAGINNFEAWVDYRRVGIPSTLPLSLSTSRGSRVIPFRLLYPQDEYNYNNANVNAQGDINAQVDKIFWDK
ncbi:MAG TPA: SusD/RagB family nutrient-binding outer membrane lipoprotein [Chitinophagaceae bacterium]